MTTKKIPATIAAKPAQRMRFAAVGFMVRSCDRRSLCRRLVFMGLSPFVKRVIRVRVDIRPIRRCGFNLNNRKQWQAEITHFPEQAIQRGLIDDRASEDGCSVACVGEAQALKPVGPPGIKVSLEANFVPSRLVMILS